MAISSKDLESLWQRYKEEAYKHGNPSTGLSPAPTEMPFFGK